MYRLLIVGGGSIGERHLRCFLKTGRVTASVCDNRPARLKELAALYNVASTHASFDDIDLSKFDAVVICVYADLHVPWGLRAVEAGAHVLIEKPLSTGLAGINELETAADKRQRVVGVAHVRRAQSDAIAVKKELDSGRIGQALSLTCLVGYDHRMTRPDYLSTYWTRRATGGGAVLDMSSHTSNYAQWLLGPVTSVTAAYDHLQMEGTPCEDTLSYVLRFRNSPAMATIHCSAWQAHRCNLLMIAGTKGSIVCDAVEGRMGTVDCRNRWQWVEGLAGKTDSKGQNDEPFIRQAANFLDAVEDKAPILCSLAEGKHTIEICSATYESGQRRAEVIIPP